MTTSTDHKRSLFASRMDSVRRSFVRELTASATSRESISFGGGCPPPDCLPVEAVALAAAETLRQSGFLALQYGSTPGFPPLRAYIAENILARAGVRASPDQVMITNGSQQALDLLGKVFLDDGDLVLLEAPSYLAAIQAFQIYRPRFRTVPLLDDGVDADALDKALKQERPRFFYAVPTYQNPTGVCYSPKNRRAVVETLRKHDAFLVEDSPYGELNLDDEPAPPPMARDLEGRAVLMGSFSKILAPGFRLGWIFAPDLVMERLTLAKEAADLCTGHLMQRMLFELLTHYDLEAHLTAVRVNYRRRRDRMIELLGTHFPAGTSWRVPAGGMFMWATLPEGIDTTVLVRRTMGRGVFFTPGACFYPDSGGENAMRLNFTQADEGDMERGMCIIAEEAEKMMNGE
jgi:2-aminoadipate transaminase